MAGRFEEQPTRPLTTGTPPTTGTSRPSAASDASAMDQAKQRGQEAAAMAQEKGREAAQMAQERADQGLHRAGEAAEGLADTLHRQADRLPGEKTTELAHQAASSLERGAEYLRTTDTSMMRSDLEDLIRRYPTQSLAIGATVGFLLARAFR